MPWHAPPPQTRPPHQIRPAQRQACPLGYRTGSAPSDERLGERAKVKLAEMDAKLTGEQRHAVGNVAVFGFIPQFLYTERLRLRSLPGMLASAGR